MPVENLPVDRQILENLPVRIPNDIKEKNVPFNRHILFHIERKGYGYVADVRMGMCMGMCAQVGQAKAIGRQAGAGRDAI